MGTELVQWNIQTVVYARFAIILSERNTKPPLSTGLQPRPSRQLQTQPVAVIWRAAWSLTRLSDHHDSRLELDFGSTRFDLHVFHEIQTSVICLHCNPSAGMSVSPSSISHRNYIHTYIITYVHTCIRAYMHTYIYTCIRTYTYIYIKHIHTSIHTYVRVYTYIYIHTYIYTYIRT